MIRQRNIEIIRQACIKANPKIMELKPGCYVRDFFKGIGIMLAAEKDFFQRDCYDIVAILSSFGSSCVAICEILGRPIRLADALLALNFVFSGERGCSPYRIEQFAVTSIGSVFSRTMFPPNMRCSGTFAPTPSRNSRTNACNSLPSCSPAEFPTACCLIDHSSRTVFTR